MKAEHMPRGTGMSRGRRFVPSEADLFIMEGDICRKKRVNPVESDI